MEELLRDYGVYILSHAERGGTCVYIYEYGITYVPLSLQEITKEGLPANSTTR